MGSSSFSDKVQVINSAGHETFLVEVLEYLSLEGCQDIATAEALYFANNAGIRLKQVRIRLNKGMAILEPGALHFMKGRIDIQAKAGGTGGITGIAKGLASKFLANETFFKPRYSGVGDIYLEPSFGHFLIHTLNKGEKLIAEKGMFYAGEGSLGVSAVAQKNISAAALGGEGFMQTAVEGPGICIFVSPVPASEVLCLELKNERLQVDGNFALMRTDGVQFTVEKSTKSFFGAMASGEGWLQTFEGTGKVWIAPTQAVYNFLTDRYAFQKAVRGEGSSHTKA